MIRLALTNLAMFGFPMARLHLANSLARNGDDARLTDSLAGKAKLILTNPPFGACFQGNDLVKYKIATQWSRRFPGRVDSEILFVERYLEWLAPGGQLIAVVPDSILTNKAVFEDLRRGIADDIELCSVVSLPSVTFGVAGTTTKTSILHLRKKAKVDAPLQCTAFAICHDIGFTVTTKANQRIKAVLGEGDLPRILDEIISQPAKPDAVRWLPNAKILERWDAQHHASLSAEVEQRLNSKADGDVCVSDVAELVDERADPRRWGAKQFNYIEISDIDSQTCVVYSNSIETSVAPSRARKLVKAGDVLVSTVRPERGAVGVVGPHQEVRLAHLPRLQGQARAIAEAEGHLHRIRSVFNESISEAGLLWRQMSLMAGSKPHPTSQTISRRRSDKSDSGSHGQDIFQLAADRKA